jgi:hypothetical membrane protein
MPTTSTVPWWGRVSSVLAPVLLIGGWTLAASLQPGGFDSRTGTISELAGLDATARWVMTLGIAGVGACHVTTALALRPAARTGRILLGLGGVASLLVATFPLPSGGGGSLAHSAVATASFVLLTIWAAYAGIHEPGAPWGLRRPVAVVAFAVLAVLTGWFFVTAVTGSGDVGLAERVAAGAQALWPAVVVATVPVVRRTRQGMLTP